MRYVVKEAGDLAFEAGCADVSGSGVFGVMIEEGGEHVFGCVWVVVDFVQSVETEPLNAQDLGVFWIAFYATGR